MAGKPGESQEAQAEANRPAATSSDADKNYNAGSGNSNAGSGNGSPGASGGDRDRQGGGNTDGGDGGKAARDAADDARAKATQDAVDRDRQKAADDARAKATQDAVDRERIQAALAEGMRQSQLQRLAAEAASLRGVPLPPQVQEARMTPGQLKFQREVNLDAAYDAAGAINPTVSMIRPDLQEVSVARQEAAKTLGIPSINLMAMGSGMVMNPPPVSPMSGQGTIGPRPVKDPTLPTSALDRFYSGEMGYKAPAVGIDNVSSEHREKMIRAVIGEAANQGPIGMQAAAFSMTNRLQAGTYGSTIGDVVTAKGQYSAFNEGNPAGNYAYSVSEDSPTYKAAAAAVDAVLSGSVRDPTFGAVNYANVAEVNRTYTQDEINRGLAPSQASIDRVNAASADPSAIRIGAHTFTNNSAISGPGVSGTQPPAVATLGETIKKTLVDTYNSITPKAVASAGIQAGAYAISPLLGVANTVSGYLGGPTIQDTFLGGPTAQQEFNRDRQMTQEEVNIAEFNRLYPNAGSDKELYGGNDNRGIASLPKIPKKPVVPETTTPPPPPVYTTGIDFSPGYYQGPPISTETYSPNPEYNAGYNRLG